MLLAKKILSAPAVIARCGIERSAACGAEAKGTTHDDCISEKGESKVFELSEGGAERRKLNVFARWREPNSRAYRPDSCDFQHRRANFKGTWQAVFRLTYLLCGQ